MGSREQTVASTLIFFQSDREEKLIRKHEDYQYRRALQEAV